MCERRVARLLGADKRAFILAMDHQRVLRAPRLDGGRIADLLAAAQQAGADGAMVTLAAARRWGHLAPRLSLVASVSSARPDVALVVDEALRLDCQAIKYEVFPLTSTAEGDYAYLESLVLRADRVGLPVMAEVVPGGFDAASAHSVANLSHACTIAAEIGTRLLKIPPPTDGQLGPVVEAVPIPVLILGGPRDGESDLSDVVRAAIRYGAAGAIVGRHVFDSDDPEPALHSLVAAVHGA